MVTRFMQWVEDTYIKMNQQLGQSLYHNMRQEDVTPKQLAENNIPFSQAVAKRIHSLLDKDEAQGKLWNRPLRRFPSELENQVQAIVVDIHRLSRDRQIMLKPLDNHWVQHLTGLDVLREGIGLRAIGQQNPLVAYQKEAYEMYQQMMDSVQRTIVRSLFLVPRQTPRQP